MANEENLKTSKSENLDDSNTIDNKAIGEVAHVEVKPTGDASNVMLAKGEEVKLDKVTKNPKIVRSIRGSDSEGWFKLNWAKTFVMVPPMNKEEGEK